MSISDMFNKAFESASKKSSSNSNRSSTPKTDSYPFRIFEANWNWGTVTGLLIPDKNNVPFRVIKNMYLGSFVEKTEEGDKKINVVWTASSSYTKELTKEERDINEAILTEIRELSVKMTGSNGRFIDKTFKLKRVKEYTLMYMLVNKITNDRLPEDDDNYSKEYTEPGVVLYVNRTTGFFDKLRDAIKMKGEESEDDDWMENYFSRNLGERHDFTLVKTILNSESKRYDVTVSLPHYSKKKVIVNEEHLENSSDLSKEVIDLSTYNLEYNKSLLESLRNVNKGLDEANELEEVDTVDLGLKSPELVDEE